MTEVTMRERKKEATKTNIMNAGIELIKELGFADTTMQLIAAKADVALRTLYNYFPSKESIVGTYMRTVVMAEESKSWNQLMDYDSTYERLAFICRKIAGWSEDNLILTEVYAADPRNYYYATNDHVPRSGIDEIVAKVMEMGQEMGDITKSAEVTVLVRQFMGFFYMSLLTWLGNPDLNLLRLLEEGLDILYRGIQAETVDTSAVLWGMFY